jgi:membrane-associated PAP2 superfamily phosphatase
VNASSNVIAFGIPKLPARYASLVMPLLLSIVMTCIVSAISTLRGIGFATHFLRIWLGAWLISWIIAFPTLLLILPVVRRATARIVRSA